MYVRNRATKLGYVHIDNLFLLTPALVAHCRGSILQRQRALCLTSRIICHFIISFPSDQGSLTRGLIWVHCYLTVDNELVAIFVAYWDHGRDRVSYLLVFEIHFHTLWQPVIPLTHYHDVIDKI